MKTFPWGSMVGSALFLSYFWYCILYPTEWHFIDAVNLIFHEAGHAICIFFPQLITATAGSFFQLLIPAVFVVYFYQRREVLSASLLMLWFAQNLMSVSLYMRDAIPMKIPLLGGDSVTHDWNYIFSSVGLLRQSAFIADIFLMISYICLIASTILIIKYFYKKSNV